jgi:hypothetical protein
MNEHERNRIDEVNSKYKERWRCNNWGGKTVNIMDWSSFTET